MYVVLYKHVAFYVQLSLLSLIASRFSAVVASVSSVLLLMAV